MLCGIIKKRKGDIVEKIKKESNWYDNPDIITIGLAFLSFIIIITSQSFAINNNMSSMDIMRSILNHNTIYLVTLFYFITIRTKIGKKYFNFLNVLLIAIYFIKCIAGFFTIFQSFGLTSLIGLMLHVIIFLYLVYTFIRDTRIWQELKLQRIPFDEIGNDVYFYLIVILSATALVVNLIDASNFEEVCVSLLDTIYYIAFGRYIYLYKVYSDSKRKQVKKLRGDKNV